MNLALPTARHSWYSGGVPVLDGQGTWYAAGLVKNTNVDSKHPEFFKFRIFKYVDGKVQEIALQVAANGNGGAFVAPYNGKGYWYAFVDGVGQFNEIPGFIPVALGGGTVIVNPPANGGADLSAILAQFQAVDQRSAQVAQDARATRQAVAFVQDGLNKLTAIVSDLQNTVAKLPNMDFIWQKILDGAHGEIEKQWESWHAYADRRLYDTIWDRTVKLLRNKEKKGLTAEQMPLNEKE